MLEPGSKPSDVGNSSTLQPRGPHMKVVTLHKLQVTMPSCKHIPGGHIFIQGLLYIHDTYFFYANSSAPTHVSTLAHLLSGCVVGEQLHVPVYAHAD